MQRKYYIILEKFWLVMTFLVAAFCIYEFIVDPPYVAKWYLIALLIPLAMYLFRRFMRIRLEKHLEEAENQKKQ